MHKLISAASIVSTTLFFTHASSAALTAEGSDLKSVLAHEFEIRQCAITRPGAGSASGKVTHLASRDSEGRWTSDSRIEVTRRMPVKGKPATVREPVTFSRRLVINAEGAWEVAGPALIKLPPDLPTESPGLGQDYVKAIYEELESSTIDYLDRLALYRITPSPRLESRLREIDPKRFAKSGYTIDLLVGSTHRHVLGIVVNQAEQSAQPIRNYSEIRELDSMPDDFLRLPPAPVKYFPSTVNQYHKVLMNLLMEKVTNKTQK